MGMSEPFDSEESAMEWILEAIGEDQNQALDDRAVFKTDFGVGDNVFMTESERQDCYYAIVEEAS